ncbi:hypothetical protein Moror_4303 [Moniliophthora roreri MCA 2997]|uniref:Uncharacterized protein n=1 Tax=Moniliophthora roreri (strain MCA 2997) TaxID=1381753 RepID=V2XMV1_MONRO|nr:hypothetical protein Moror_4303 [Moniliophthora roreri MCA 2997]
MPTLFVVAAVALENAPPYPALLLYSTAPASTSNPEILSQEFWVFLDDVSEARRRRLDPDFDTGTMFTSYPQFQSHPNMPEPSLQVVRRPFYTLKGALCTREFWSRAFSVSHPPWLSKTSPGICDILITSNPPPSTASTHSPLLSPLPTHPRPLVASECQ